MKALLAAVLLSAVLIPSALPQTWKNQEESDIGIAAGGEADPVKKLDLLKKWEQQYPDSALQEQRTFMTTQALTGLITASFGKPEGPALDAGKKAAQQLIDGINTYFGEALLKLPQLAQMAPEAWTKARNTSELQAHALLANIAALRKDDAPAESEYKKVLGLDPSQAESSYRLGAIVIHEMAVSKDYSRYSEALYHLARSLAVTGPAALSPAGRSAAEKALKTNYQNYHDSTEGLDDLIKLAATSALPAPDFHILSKIEIAEQKDRDHDAWVKDHPDLAFWETIRTALQTQGDAFFANLQGVAFPPVGTDAYKGPAMFKGTVVSVQSPKQILLNVDNAAGDAILKFEDTIKGDIPAGTVLQFKGVVEAYTKDPYTLTITIQEPKTDIAGLPEGVTFGPAAKPASKPPVRPATKAPPARKK